MIMNLFQSEVIINVNIFEGSILAVNRNDSRNQASFSDTGKTTVLCVVNFPKPFNIAEIMMYKFFSIHKIHTMFRKNKQYIRSSQLKEMTQTPSLSISWC